MKHKIKVTVNEELYELEVDSNRSLLEFLRDDLGLTGTKEGCGNGECGACSVIVNGEVIRSCLALAVEMDGCDITTIEGVAKSGELDKLQKAFIEYGAIQCGFCTPGFIMSGKALLDKNPHPSDEEILDAIGGHLCRCGAYHSIIEAIKKASSI